MSELIETKVISHGIEIVKISHIQELIEQSGEHFEMECFTATELNTPALGAKRIEYLGGRFAAKKAILKILEIGNHPEISWLDIEIQRLPSGEPLAILQGKCQAIATKFRITKWLLSISHTSSYAAASAIALCAVPEAIALGSSLGQQDHRASYQKPNPLTPFPRREGGTRGKGEQKLPSPCRRGSSHPDRT